MMNKDEGIRYLVERGCVITEWLAEPYIIVDSWSLSEIENDERFYKAVCAVTGSKYNYAPSDVLATCCECGNAIETSPSSYAWTPQYWRDNGGLICLDCVKSNYTEEYIEDCIQRAEAGKLVRFLLDATQHGFRLIAKGLQYGLHEHMNEDPRTILSWAGDRGFVTLFDVRASQFYTEFDVYMKWNNDESLSDKDVEEIQGAILAQRGKYSDSLKTEFRQRPSPADNAKRLLKQRSKP